MDVLQHFVVALHCVVQPGRERERERERGGRERREERREVRRERWEVSGSTG